MRSVSFGLGVGFLLVACGGDEAKPQPMVPTPAAEMPAPAATASAAEAPTEAPKAAPSLAELEKKTVMGIGEAMNAHDAKKLASFYTDGAVLKVPGMPDMTGRDAIAADTQKRFDMMANTKSMATHVFVKGEVVVVEWTMNATHSGDMMGVKATEKPIGVMGADVLWFSAEGLVKEQHTYVDVGTILSQIGVTKQKGRPVPAMPTGAPTVVVASGAADEAKNVDAASKMFAAFEKKSDADFLGASSDDVTWDEMTQPEATKGKAAGKKYFAAMTTAFPDVKVTTQNAWGIGDVVIAETTLSGTHKAAFFGIQPTKKSINVHGLDIMQFKDGKVVSGRTYGNGGEMMGQLGLLPPPGAKPAAGAAPQAPAPATAPAKK